MIYASLCDDERAAITIISKKIQKCFDAEDAELTLDTFQDPYELREQILSGVNYQVLFLDVDMPDLDGIDLAEHLRKAGFNGLVIFISNRSEKVFDSLKVQPFRFIRKGKFNTEIGIVVRDILKELTPKPTDTLMFHSRGSVVRINPYDIMYVEAQRKQQYIHTLQDEIEINSGFEDICAQLSPLGFIRIHKGFLVNYRFIFSIDKAEVILDNMQALPLARQRAKEVKESFQSYVMG